MELLQKSVSARLYRWLLDDLQRDGIDREAICKSIGIREHELDAADARVAGDRHVRMTQLLEGWTLSHRPPVPGVAGWLRPFPELAGVVCNRPTMRDALRRFVQYRELIGNVDWLLMHEETDAIAFDYVLEGDGRSACCALGNFAIIADIARLYDPSIRVREAGLTGTLPAPNVSFGDVLGSPIRVDQQRNRIVLASARLDASFEQFNPTLAGIHLHAADEVRHKIRMRASFGHTVEACLVEWLREPADDVLPEHMQSRLCERFAISRWTLRRRLLNEQTSFHDLLTRARTREAKQLLLQTQLPIRDIGERVGFTSTSAFTRFFTRVSGAAPTHYRSTRGAR
ncbi:helix-turn-helix transcriptional regulator [Paraburkholderia haematera]|uniref:HTH araC/xylS-type domain-containing protein n=1 Tax=Paraburkholderia haematera TaxID=2793077 RepID=A0ABN7KLU8_9BURK|nr:AraC family transcriptional regulator [Paraburkholderia haematera]CAE6699572.1 hypothetical protein R69888_00666 [Paraburkholderia haematera]